MSAGTPLTDADRWDWLILLRQECLRALSAATVSKIASPSSANPSKGVVLTCSALKRKYRDVFRVAAYHSADVRVHFLFLDIEEEQVLARVRARQNHYMKEDMVRSQFEGLEPPGEDEDDVSMIVVDGDAEHVIRKSVARAKEILDLDEKELER